MTQVKEYCLTKDRDNPGPFFIITPFPSCQLPLCQYQPILPISEYPRGAPMHPGADPIGVSEP